MQNNGGVGDAVSLTTAQMEDQQRKTRPRSDSWAKLLNSTHNNNNNNSAASTHNPAAPTATAAIWSSYGMMEGGGGGGGGGSTAMGCISNGSSASADREGTLSRIMFQAEPFPCGPFTRLLDPSANISPETIELGLEDFPSSSGTVPVAAAAAASSLPQLQVSTHPVPSLRSPASFGSSSILTFHSNMNKPEVAYPPNPRQKPTGTGSPSSSSTSSNTTVQKSTIEEGECNTEQKRSSEQAGLTAAPGTCNTSSKKSKSESSGGPMKVRKEKLGERINALQQLVSPYGKTDTASVLQEAMGYIKFLQEQVQVLSTPYLKGIPSSQTVGRGDQAKYDLRSRGLCLVPVSCTLHVANNNGADFWTSGIGSGSKF